MKMPMVIHDPIHVEWGEFTLGCREDVTAYIKMIREAPDASTDGKVDFLLDVYSDWDSIVRFWESQ